MEILGSTQPYLLVTVVKNQPEITKTPLVKIKQKMLINKYKHTEKKKSISFDIEKSYVKKT